MTIALAALLLAVAALLAFSCRYAWWRRAVDYRQPRILMYHMIRSPLRGGRFNKLRVAPAAFERQLQYLCANGWRFAFLSELGEMREERGGEREGGREEKTVVLTFDDGFRDNYAAAHPLLAKYGAKATLFLVVDRFGRDWSTAKKAHHDSGELMREDKLRDPEVAAMLDSGVWELGAHTLTHALLPSLDEAERQREIGAAKTLLEERYGTAVASFAYPCGIYGQDDVAAAAAAGYRFAVTTDAGISADPRAEALALRRIKVSGKEGPFAFALRLRTGRRGIRE